MIKIAIVDTNVRITHPIFRGANIHITSNTEFNLSSEYSHGTAVCHEIIKICPDASIEVFPIFDNNFECDPIIVLEVLKNIAEKADYSIVNLSFGLSNAEFSNQFETICKQLHDTGTIVVAAFDNGGAMSYPACIDSVIGVDCAQDVDDLSVDDYIYIKGTCVNILGTNRQRRIAWDAPDFIMARGTSFICAHITGVIAQFISSNGKSDYEAVEKYLQSNSRSFYNYTYDNVSLSLVGKNCAVYPINKEIESLIRMKKFLRFELIACYDNRLSNNIGKSITTHDGDDVVVRNVDTFDPAGIDVFVIGHIDKYINQKTQKSLKNIFLKCICNKISVFAFDNSVYDLFLKLGFSERDNIIHVPTVTKKDIDFSQLGKLWDIPIPVVGVVGTGSQQGKFTTQVELIHFIRSAGYQVGFISTEPSGKLFGAQRSFPYGYKSTVMLDKEYMTMAFNRQAYELYQQGNDIIVFGLQGSILPYNNLNVRQTTVIQQELLFGLPVDCFVLCVSPSDSIEYINQTITYLQVTTQALVLGILVYPIVHTLDKHGNVRHTLVDEEVINSKIIAPLKAIYDIPVLLMDEKNVGIICDELLLHLQEQDDKI